MMKSLPTMTGVWAFAAILSAAYFLCLPVFFTVHAAGSLPEVRLNADAIRPRPIEELTGKNITRDYACAVRDVEAALSKNDDSLLNEYFTGFAKSRIKQRISEQRSANIRVLYTDHGHDVRALFYSVGGDEMQLVDHAILEIQIFDDNKLIHQENITQNYLVLMTPGADRWFVRSWDPVPEKQL